MNAYDETASDLIAEARDKGREAGHADYVGNDGTRPDTPNPYKAVRS